MKKEIRKHWTDMNCPWCGKSFDLVMASCGSGSTWSLFGCPHCGKFTAIGDIIPIEAQNKSDTKYYASFEELKEEK